MMREKFFMSVLKKMAAASFADFCRERNIKLAVLFGSCAMGRHKENSDLDLALLLDDRSFPRLDLARGELKRTLVREIAMFFQTSRVDVVLLNQASLLLQLEVVRSGKVVYEQSPGEFAAFASLTVRRQSDARLLDQLHKAYLKN